MIGRRQNRGFTLVETLVSLAIATLAVVGFYQGLSQGLFMERRADSQAAQMLVATQIMDRIGVDVSLRAGVTENGSLHGLDWTMVMSDRPTDDMMLGFVQSGEIVYIFVSVESDQPGGAPLVLRALRYAEIPL